MKWVITIESDERMPIEAWKALRSRVDFVLERHCPHAHTYIDIKDKKCPRQEKPVRAEDMI
jgi:hypothetical protein